jgi:serine/threonine protein kinase
MIVICPYCKTSLDTGPGVLWVECTACRQRIDLSALGTTPGHPVLPRDRELRGRVFGKYTLEELIGIGGMGVVYRARGEGDETVAVKILYYAAGESESIKKRFDRETGILESLEHPNIVRLIDRGRQDGYMYIVMEYVPGNLAEKLRASTLPFTEIAGIVTDITGALAFAHERKIIHRDLKPTNILLSPGGAKISDFGIAHIEYDRDATSLTQTAAVLGTFNYMSPEQRMGEKDIDRRADIYSLGVLLYELFTGRVPIGSFPKVSSIRRDAPAGVDAVVEKALSQDRDRRYEDVAAFRLDLLKALSNGGRRAMQIAWTAAAVVLVAAAFFIVGKNFVGTSDRVEDAGVTMQAPAEAAAANVDPKNVAMTAGTGAEEEKGNEAQPSADEQEQEQKQEPPGKENTKQNIAAMQETGTLVAASTPSAAVWIDGKKTGRTTPVSPKNPIDLNAGSHKVSFVLPTGESFHYTVKIRPGEQTKLVRSLEPKAEPQAAKTKPSPKIKKKQGKGSLGDPLSDLSSDTK